MNIGRMNNNAVGMYNLFNTMYQGNMAMNNNRLSRNLFPNSQTQGQRTLTADSVQFVNDIKASSKALSGAVRDLSGAAFSNNRTMTSSNNDVLTISYSGNRPASTVSPMTVKVDQTAAGQLNEGNSMNSAATFEGGNGANRISIETGGKTTQLSVNVSASDTNLDVQQKMADAINNAGLNVKATVVTDSETKTSTLKIESTTTGSDSRNSFKVSDVSGDLAARTGVNEVTRENRDAIYSVNGGATRTSQSNTVHLGDGISATLKNSSSDVVTISPGKDMQYVKSSVEKLVKSYNDLYSESAQRTNDPKSQNLASRMINTSKAYTSSLSEIGIGFDKDGKMTLDTKKLDQAAESGKLEQFFTENSGKNYGFTNQLSRLADNVSRNTSNFVSSSQFGSSLSEGMVYSSLGSLMQFNSFGAGSLFDFMF